MQALVECRHDTNIRKETANYETVSSLKARLDGMCTDVDMGNLKSMAWFICRKAK